jgi:hypothetical protein
MHEPKFHLLCKNIMFSFLKMCYFNLLMRRCETLKMYFLINIKGFKILFFHLDISMTTHITFSWIKIVVYSFILFANL